MHVTSPGAAGPYRSAEPREQPLRPLEPEEEMRLLLEAADLPRGVRAWGIGALAIGALVALGATMFEPMAALAAIRLFADVAPTSIAWLRHRRRIARLRQEGYDVDRASLRKRVVDAQRVRVDAELPHTFEDDRRDAEDDQCEAEDARSTSGARR